MKNIHINRALMAKKKMYKEPKTVIEAVEATMNICHVSGDGHVKVNNDTPPFNGKVI